MVIFRQRSSGQIKFNDCCGVKNINSNCPISEKCRPQHFERQTPRIVQQNLIISLLTIEPLMSKGGKKRGKNLRIFRYSSLCVSTPQQVCYISDNEPIWLLNINCDLILLKKTKVTRPRFPVSKIDRHPSELDLQQRSVHSRSGEQKSRIDKKEALIEKS